MVHCVVKRTSAEPHRIPHVTCLGLLVTGIFGSKIIEMRALNLIIYFVMELVRVVHGRKGIVVKVCLCFTCK